MLLPWGAVIVAAGRGTRFGRPKQLAELAGIPLVAWSVDCFAGMAEIAHIVVVTEPDLVERMERLLRERSPRTPLDVVPGGADRQASAAHGLAAVSSECPGIFVHDGARPLVQAGDVRAGMQGVRTGIGALLAAPVVDTIKVVDARGVVVETPDRATLWSAQTPQFATAADLRRAHAEAVRCNWPRATDDAALLERAGVEVHVVAASPDNVKVTLPGDLARAEALLAERTAAAR